MELNKYFLNWFHKERSCLVYFLLQIYITTHVLTVFFNFVHFHRILDERLESPLLSLQRA